MPVDDDGLSTMVEGELAGAATDGAVVAAGLVQAAIAPATDAARAKASTSRFMGTSGDRAPAIRHLRWSGPPR